MRWWIENYTSEYEMLHRGKSAIKVALQEAGIDIPFKAYALTLRQADGGANPEDAAGTRTGSQDLQR